MASDIYSKKIMTSNWLNDNFKPNMVWGYCPKSFTISMNIDDGFNIKKYKGEFKYIFDSIDTTTNYVVYKMNEKNYLYRMDASEVINASNTSIMRDNLNLSTLYLPINDMTLRVNNLCRVVNGSYIPLNQSYNGISVESIEVTNQSGVLYDCIFSGSEFGGNYINNNKFDSSSLLPNYNGTDNKAVTYNEYGNIFNIATDSSKCITESASLNITWYPIIGNVRSSTFASTKGCFKRGDLVNGIKIMPPSISGWKDVVSDNDNFLLIDNKSYYYIAPDNRTVNLINESINYGVNSISRSGDYAFGNYFYYTNNAKRDPSVYYDSSNLFQLSESKFDNNYIYEGCYLNKNYQSTKSLKKDTYEIYQGDLYANRKPHIAPSITKADIDTTCKDIYKNVVKYLDCSTAVEIYKHPTLYNTYLTNVSRKYDDIIAKPNEIWYTSTDGNIITPTTTYWGVTISSNTYENGIGKIIFNTNITKIGYQSFVNKSNLKSIIIPEGVTLIDVEAFSNCSNLTSVTIPDSVTSIESSAFENCKGLTSITIPDSVTSIGYEAFYNCSSLTSVTIPDSVTWIGERAFYNCSSLTSVTIGDSVTTIGGSAFYYCTNLKSVYCKALIPPTIETDTFFQTNTDKKIYVPSASLNEYRNASIWSNMDIKAKKTNSYNRVIIYKTSDDNIIKLPTKGIDCFNANIISNEYNDNLRKGVIIFDNDVTKIDASVFKDCSNLVYIEIPNTVTYIGNSAFRNCDGLTSVTIPDSVTTIGDYAFYGCNNLTSVTIPDGVIEIGNYAFSYCNLTSVTIPDGVIEIGDYAFGYCSRLTSVTIPDSVTTIGDWAFSSCTNLTSVTIPDGVIEIGREAFYGCSRLTSIYCQPTTPPYIGYYAFPSKSKVYVYPKSIYDNALNNGGMNSNPGGVFTVYNSKITYTTNDNQIPEITTSNFDIDEYQRTSTYISFYGYIKRVGYSAFFNCTNLTSVIIPDGVTEIGQEAFRGCSSLTSVTIPYGVTTIGDYAFEDCTNLTSVTIPDSVTTIGDYAFYGCNNLTSVTIPDSVTTIGMSAFSGCTGELIVNCNIPSASSSSYGAFYGSKFTTVTIGDSVTTIGDRAFYGCSSLTSVTISDGVTTIGNYAFYGCSNLTNVTIPDSVTTIGNYAFYNCSSLTSVTIGESVTKIGNRAFYNTKNMITNGIKCKAISIPTLGTYAFYSGISIKVINALKNEYENATNWSNYTITNLYEENSDDVVVKYNTICPDAISVFGGEYLFYNKNENKGIGILTNNEIDGFADNYNLSNIILPEGIIRIKENAFSGCTNLKSIIIPSTVEEIGDYAFYGCRSLEYVIFKSETPCKIGKGVFSNTNIKVIYVPNNSYDISHPFEIKEDENGNAIIPIVSVPSIFEQDNTIPTNFNLKEYAYCAPHTELKKQVNVSHFETLGISINNDNVNDVLIDKFGKLKGVYRVYGSYTDASNVDRSFDIIVDESYSNDDTFGNITYKLDSSGNIYCNFNFEEPSYVNEYCVDLIGVRMEDKAKAQILFGVQSDTYKDWNSLPLKVYQKLTPGIESKPPTDSASLTNVIGDFDNE